MLYKTNNMNALISLNILKDLRCSTPEAHMARGDGLTS